MKNVELSSEQYPKFCTILAAEKNSKTVNKINSLILSNTGQAISKVAKVLFPNNQTLRTYVNFYRKKNFNSVSASSYKDELDRQTFLRILAVYTFVKREFGVAYSPELNLITPLCKIFKKNIIDKQYYDTFKGFQLTCIEITSYRL